MDQEVLESLLAKLSQGDLNLARQIFQVCEAPLRKMVRRQLPARLRPKFDSADVVQSVWADLLDGFRTRAWHFHDVQRLQAFLLQVTRNRFNDKFRKHRQAFEKEQNIAGLHSSEMPFSPQPQPPALLEAEELWESMLELCPPEHQELLRLKRQGWPMEELVLRTGLHPGSIRRILRNLASKLALRETGVP